ncbi:MAG: lasso peptide biosynthesis B2 protein [Acidobacteria bacterium]|nr:lasso peptide biosynthesis B2 protein [Acidobacteriota bacterium]
MPRWRKFRELSWSDRGFLLFAIGGLAVVGLMLPVGGFERTVTRLRHSSRRAGDNDPGAEDREATGDRGTGKARGDSGAREWARRRAYLVSVAARFGPYRATCLRRSLFLWWLTRRRGLDSKLQIGVRRERSEQGKLVAHAWIELDGEVLNDRAEIVEGYAAFDAKQLPNRVSWS